MSRSRKKSPVVKDSGGGLRPILRRSYRRTVRQIVKHYCKSDGWISCQCECCEDYEPPSSGCYYLYRGFEPVIPLRDEIWDRYSTCDWKMSEWYGYKLDPKVLRK